MRELLECNHVRDVPNCALKLIEFLQLGKLEKGSLSPLSKYLSCNSCWFTAKTKKLHLKEMMTFKYELETTYGTAIWANLITTAYVVITIDLANLSA